MIYLVLISGIILSMIGYYIWRDIQKTTLNIVYHEENDYNA